MKKVYAQRVEKIEAVLNSWLPQSVDSVWLEKVFGPKAPPDIELAASLVQPGWDLVNRGGKRWRPLLMLLVAECIAGARGVDAVLPLVPLVEFPHTASLVHDDIEDSSEQRRGKPAVHLIYGMDTAINSGSFMYFLPLACLDQWTGDAGLKNHIWTIWASHLRKLHLGQAMDIAWHRDYNSLPTLDEYDRMCRYKTGCLARLAAVLGVHLGVVAGASSWEISPDDADLWNLADIFGKAAEQLGVGFQILDDVKNLTDGIPGKTRGDDIVEGKKSLPVLLYLHKHPEKKEFAARCFSAAKANGIAAPEVEEFIAEMQGAGVLEKAREKAFEYIEESRCVFSAPYAANFVIKKEYRELFSGFLDFLS